MQISKEYLDELRRHPHNDLLQVMQEAGTELSRQGPRWHGECPLCRARSSTLTVDAQRGEFRCSNCGACGNVIGFVKQRGLSSSPLQWLEERAGMALDRGTPSSPRPSGAASAGPAGRAVSLERAALLDAATEHYHRTFLQSAPARAYLKRREIINPHLFAELKLGYADGSLAESVRRSRPRQRELQRLGLLDGRGSERFQGCLVIPFLDERGRCVDLYGRSLSSRSSRPPHCYLPGARAALFNPLAYRGHGELILCQDLLHALILMQHRHANVSALDGPQGLTVAHLEAFRNGTVRRVYLAFDADRAGHAGAQAIAEQLHPLGLPCHRIELPEFCDVDRYFRHVGGNRETFRALLNRSRPLLPVEPPTNDR